MSDIKKMINDDQQFWLEECLYSMEADGDKCPLNKWEQDFVNDISNQDILSDYQIDKLQEIYQKIVDAFHI